MFQFHIWALLRLFALLSSLSTASRIVLEEAGHLPAGWKVDRHATASDWIQLSIALKELGIEELKRRLLQQSTSDDHPNSRHLTKGEVEQHRQPDWKSVTAVGRWLQSHGIKSYKADNSWITFDAAAATVQALFEADLAYYSYNGDPSTQILRARSYTIPPWLSDDIDFIHPLTNFMPPRNRNDVTLRVNGRQPTQPKLTAREDFFAPPCWTGTFPGCIRKLYNITYIQPPDSHSPSPVRFGIAGFLEQYITHRDVTSFLATYAPELLPLTPTPSRGGSGGSLTLPPVTNTTTEPPYNITITLLNNATRWDPHSTDPALSGLEANLDVQYALSLGYPTQVIYYATGGRGTKLDSSGRPLPANDPRANNEPFLEFLQALLALPDNQIPHVLSISYADDEQSVPRKYAHRVCDLFAALAARGTSVLVATGDGGAAGIGFSAGGGDSCIKNDGSGRRALVPTFPASCPWVTSVGATDHTALNLTGAAFSSGGFSEYFDRPLWQRAAVDPYVASLLRSQSSKPGQPTQPRDPKGVYFSHNGRGMPDIAAIGSGFQIMHRGEMVEVRGTSASTPVVAAMVALINDQRLRQGKRSLGWLNGYLYLDPRMRGVLTDVNWGRSEGCDFPGEAMEEDEGEGEGKGRGRRHNVVKKRQGNSTEDDGTHGERGDSEGHGEKWEWDGGVEVGQRVQSGNVVLGGWDATKGWDPVTGLGVPGDFQDMLKVLGSVW